MLLCRIPGGQSQLVCRTLASAYAKALASASARICSNRSNPLACTSDKTALTSGLHAAIPLALKSTYDKKGNAHE